MKFQLFLNTQERNPGETLSRKIASDFSLCVSHFSSVYFISRDNFMAIF